jgi:type III secretion system YscQ/HrcQ family protein
MGSENARGLSKGGIVDADAHAASLRRAAVARLGSASLVVGGAALETDVRDTSNEDGAEHSDNPDEEDGEPVSSSAAALLDDVTVAMVVELGRVTVTAADVVGLRAGQVIELSRQPGEPVDLVVDGKRIGKGELVEIDGELGVRILSLVK